MAAGALLIVCWSIFSVVSGSFRIGAVAAVAAAAGGAVGRAWPRRY